MFYASITQPSTAHIKYSSVMLALYIYIIVLGRNKKQNFGVFFVSDYQIILYGLMALSLCCAGLGYSLKYIFLIVIRKNI